MQEKAKHNPCRIHLNRENGFVCPQVWNRLGAYHSTRLKCWMTDLSLHYIHTVMRDSSSLTLLLFCTYCSDRSVESYCPSVDCQVLHTYPSFMLIGDSVQHQLPNTPRSCNSMNFRNATISFNTYRPFYILLKAPATRAHVEILWAAGLRFISARHTTPITSAGKSLSFF